MLRFDQVGNMSAKGEQTGFNRSAASSTTGDAFYGAIM
jgi:hypothetical protein